MDEQVELLLGVLLQPGQGALVDFAVVHVDVQSAALRGINVELVTASEAVFPVCQVIDGAGGVPGALQSAGEATAPTVAPSPGAPWATDSVGDRVLTGIDGGERRMSGNRRGQVFFEDHTLRRERIDIRRGIAMIPIAAEMIGAQGVHNN